MSTPSNHLMVMAGGTGGHVFPALAVAQELRARGTRVSWLGTKAGLEAKVIPANDIPIRWISIEGLRGKGLLSWIKAPFKLVAAVWQSWKVLRQERPDCVLGMGGFVAGPGGLAARLTRTPLVIHEQNAVAGLTNKWLAKAAQRVLAGFAEVTDLPNARWVGNPVRKEINDLKPKPIVGSPLNVLIIGGSQGAHSFNVYLPDRFAQCDSEIEIWHQCGRGKADAVEAQYQKNSQPARVSEFIEDMAAAYAWADVLICRAGAMTIAECSAAGKPAVFVPFPYSAGDHQTINAQAMVNAGAGIMLANERLAQTSSSAELNTFFADLSVLNSMSVAAAKLHKPKALDDVVAVCEEYLHA